MRLAAPEYIILTFATYIFLNIIADRSVMALKKQNFLKGSVILMLSAAAAKLLGAIFRIPLTNMLGGAGMSCFSCAYTVFLPVYALTTAGISSASARMTAECRALGLDGDVQRIRRVSFILFSAFGLAGSGAVILLAVPFSLWSCGSYEAVPAILMISPAVLFGCMTASERGYYEGLSNMYPTAVSQTIEGFIKAGAGIALCVCAVHNGERLAAVIPWTDDTRSIAAAAGILGVTLSSLGAVVFFAVLKLFQPGNTAGKPIKSRKSTASELLRTSFPAGLSAVVTNLTAIIDMWTIIACTQIPDRLPAGVSSADYPQFVYGSFAGIALTIFNLVPSVTNMLGKGVIPVITGAWAAGDGVSLRRGTQQALLTAAVLSVPCAAGLAVLAPQVLAFLFPERTAEAELCVMPVRLLMPGMVMLCLAYPVFGMLQSTGKPAAPLKIMLIGAGVKLAGNLLLVPAMGADGAAAATTICYAVILFSALAAYFRQAGVRLDILPFAAVLYSGGMCMGAAYLAADLTSRGGAGALVQIVSAAAAGGMLYIVCLWLAAGRKTLNFRGVAGE